MNQSRISESPLEPLPLMPMNRRLHYSTSTSGEIFGSAAVFPDLLALDQDGNLVIIELKKSKALREVTAQILEYAAWANELSEDAIIGIAATYLHAEPDQSRQR